MYPQPICTTEVTYWRSWFLLWLSWCCRCKHRHTTITLVLLQLLVTGSQLYDQHDLGLYRPFARLGPPGEYWPVIAFLSACSFSVMLCNSMIYLGEPRYEAMHQHDAVMSTFEAQFWNHCEKMFTNYCVRLNFAALHAFGDAAPSWQF